MILFKASCLMYSFFENTGGKLPKQEALVFKFLLHKFMIFFSVVYMKVLLLCVCNVILR